MEAISSAVTKVLSAVMEASSCLFYTKYSFFAKIQLGKLCGSKKYSFYQNTSGHQALVGSSRSAANGSLIMAHAGDLAFDAASQANGSRNVAGMHRRA